MRTYSEAATAYELSYKNMNPYCPTLEKYDNIKIGMREYRFQFIQGSHNLPFLSLHDH
jgi:virulence-associated protein VapD